MNDCNATAVDISKLMNAVNAAGMEDTEEAIMRLGRWNRRWSRRFESRRAGHGSKILLGKRRDLMDADDDDWTSL